VPFISITGRFIKVGYAANKTSGDYARSSSDNPHHVVDRVFIASALKASKIAARSASDTPSLRTSITSTSRSAKILSALRQVSHVFKPKNRITASYFDVSRTIAVLR
jgi:hypothetical protein